MPPMPHTVSIETPSHVVDDYGGAREAWVATVTDIPAFVQPVASNEQVRYAQRGIQVSHSVYLHSDPGDIDEQARIVWGEKYTSVVAVIDMSNLGRSWRIDCREML